MPDLMAIVSKAVFEKQAGKAAKVGTRLGMDRYVSANRNLRSLAEGGRLYLVTVRPPDEKMWLVAVLDQPTFDGKAWVAAPSTTPITDISELRGTLRFESGKGITAAPGALGMSLQTPRALTGDDTALIDALAGGAPGGGAPPAAAPADPRRLLLAAILADPGNDQARQVYADELAEAGDPRGELIMVELSLAGSLTIEKRTRLVARRAQLIRAHGATWWPYQLETRRSRAGFLEAVTVDLEQLIEGGRTTEMAEALFAAEPVTDLTVTGVEDEDAIAALCQAAWMPRVRRLVVRGGIGDGGLAALARAAATASLANLVLTNNGISGDGLAELKGGLAGCRRLCLTANELGEEVKSLTRWRHLDRLEVLYLTECELDGDGVAALIDSGKLVSLRKWTLSNNPLGDDGARAIASRAQRLPALRHLELHNTELGDQGVAALLDALPQLVRLDARKNWLDAGDRAGDARLRV